MKANKTLLRMKYARVICALAEKANISTSRAMDFFYHSIEYQLISEGVSDLHCMSDDYIAENLKDEWNENLKKEASIPIDKSSGSPSMRYRPHR